MTEVMIRRTITLGCCLLLAIASLGAQTSPKPPAEAHHGRWYIGLRGGLPFDMCTFSSFGADKTRVGLSGGIYGGYRFNRVLSLEASAAMGRAGMSTDEGCAAYWLGADGNRYLASVAGMEGWNYSDIYSSVAMQQYGVHLNVNLLGFFAATRSSRWTVNLVPALYGVSTKATIKTIDSDRTALEGDNLWHLGVGGDLMAEYAITKKLTAGIYTGITYLTGEKMDGMPSYAHNNNMIWESGIRLGWRLGKRIKKVARATPEVLQKEITQPVAERETAQPTETAKPTAKEISETTIVHTPKTDTVQAPKADKAETVIETSIAEASTAEASRIVFPTVYFGFNSVTISADQTVKLEQILVLLRKHPDMQVTVTGWCDSRGTVEVNSHISQLRAEAVKSYFTRNEIEPARIKAVGMGIDNQQPEAAKSRRVETINKK